MMFLLLTLCLCSAMNVKANSQAHVRVLRSYVTSESNSPKVMRVLVQVPGESAVGLHLTRTDKFKRVPITIAENGVSSRFAADVLDRGNRAVYSDDKSGSVFYTTKRTRNTKLQFTGHFLKREMQYLVTPLKRGHQVTVSKSFKKPALKRAFMSRQKRQVDKSSTTYVAELRLLLDYSVYSHFAAGGKSETVALADIHSYYSYVLTAMDVVFRNIKSFSISIECVDILIAKTEHDQQWMGDNAEQSNPDANDVLEKLAKWVVTQTVKADHVMAFTKKDLTMNGDNSGVAGMAPVGGICNGDNSISINEDLSHNSWSTAAHELGHNLGTSHDDSTACEASGNYIMTASLSAFTLDNLPNAYRFSTCSENVMKTHIESLSNNCLTRDDGTKVETLSQNVILGKKYTADQICKMFRPSSPGAFISNENWDNPETLCAVFFCRSSNPEEIGKSMGPSPVGLACGYQKYCTFNGKCEFDASAPVGKNPPGCFFGNRVSDKECQEYKTNLQTYPDYKDFYCPYVKENCCLMASEVCP